MNTKTFNDYLKDWHYKLFPEKTDDQLAESFDEWFASLDSDRFVRYADLFAKERYVAGMERILEIYQPNDK